MERETEIRQKADESLWGRLEWEIKSEAVREERGKDTGEEYISKMSVGER